MKVMEMSLRRKGLVVPKPEERSRNIIYSARERRAF